MFDLGSPIQPGNAEVVLGDENLALGARALTQPAKAPAMQAAALTFPAAECQKDSSDPTTPPRIFTVLVSGGDKSALGGVMAHSLALMEEVFGGFDAGPPSSTIGAQHFVLDGATANPATMLPSLDQHRQAIAPQMRCCDRLLFYSVSHGLRFVETTLADGTPLWCPSACGDFCQEVVDESGNGLCAKTCGAWFATSWSGSCSQIPTGASCVTTSCAP